MIQRIENPTDMQDLVSQLNIILSKIDRDFALRDETDKATLNLVESLDGQPSRDQIDGELRSRNNVGIMQTALRKDNKLFVSNLYDTSLGDAWPAFGEISVIANATETVITTAGVLVQITVFDTNVCSSKMTPDHTNDHINITQSGWYIIALGATIDSTAGANRKVDIRCMKNNGASTVGALHRHRDLAGGGGASGVAAMVGIAFLDRGDTIEAWIANDTNTKNIILEDISISIMQISAT